jgi:hypothetical protein
MCEPDPWEDFLGSINSETPYKKISSRKKLCRPRQKLAKVKA